MREITCPHCGQENAGVVAIPGAAVDCQSCGSSFLAPGGTDPTRARPGAGVRRGAPTDVRLTLSGLVAVAVAAVFYAAVVFPLSGTSFGELFAARGWVPYVIVLLSAWSAVMLGVKYRVLSAQVRSLSLDLLPAQIADRITPDNARVFASYIQNLPETASDNFLIDRVSRALQHFRARPRVQEVVDHLNSQAHADANAVESSYTMLRVFIWAIPILGFIGTVTGIGAAVGAFSESVAAAGDLALMKNSIGSVTTGLGVAFDTTLIALIMSLFIMFPTSSLQKAEEGFLAAVEDYCNLNLVRRLDDRVGEFAADDLQQAVAHEVARQLERGAGDPSDRLARVLERLEQSLARAETRTSERSERDDAEHDVRPLRRG
jgi:biopolymer transport protein ExbB/TolQ